MNTLLFPQITNESLDFHSVTRKVLADNRRRVRVARISLLPVLTSQWRRSATIADFFMGSGTRAAICLSVELLQTGEVEGNARCEDITVNKSSGEIVIRNFTPTSYAGCYSMYRPTLQRLGIGETPPGIENVNSSELGPFASMKEFEKRFFCRRRARRTQRR